MWADHTVCYILKSHPTYKNLLILNMQFEVKCSHSMSLTLVQTLFNLLDSIYLSRLHGNLSVLYATHWRRQKHEFGY